MKLSQRRLARPSLGGILATRQGSLILALVCAVCAAGILFVALNRYKTSIKPPVTQDTVLIATGEIAKGTPGTTIAQEKLYRSTPVAASQVTPGALSDASMLSSDTAAVNILPGQQLTAADFASFTTLSEMLPAGDRAVTVSIGEANGSTDIVQSGDHVDIWITETTGAATQGVKPILSDVLVLKPGNATPVKDQGVTIAGADMVVAVPNSQVPLLLNYATKGSLYLTLRPTDATPSAADQYAA
ncbi:MAG: Flp pilus assembly protein CpaB, partial [Solirubrobacteraceae bacterium]